MQGFAAYPRAQHALLCSPAPLVLDTGFVPQHTRTHQANALFSPPGTAPVAAFCSLASRNMSGATKGVCAWGHVRSSMVSSCGRQGSGCAAGGLWSAGQRACCRQPHRPAQPSCTTN